jgi:rhamnogalacturonyl hydrolase YesR
LYCGTKQVAKAIELAEKLEQYQQSNGGWVVRNDYDTKGAIPMLAPNDSAYIANNAFITLYEMTKDDHYLYIAKQCADWIIETARPDGLVYTGYNMRDGMWVENVVIVDTGFTAGLFAKLVNITGEKRYKQFLDRFVKRYIELFYMEDKKGFCTSIGRQNQHRGGMFARGQAWALEGLIPAYMVLKDGATKKVIDETVENLLSEQLKSGGWPYNLTRKMMGEDCKAVSVIAKDLIDWYAVSGDERIVKSARKALEWCCKHTCVEGEAAGGIFSYSIEGGIVKDLYTSCAFVYASAYAIELKIQLDRCEL